MIGGLGRGVLGGLSGKKTSDTMAKTRQYGNLRRDHGITAWDRVANSAGGALGTKNLASIQDGEVSKMEKEKRLYLEKLIHINQSLNLEIKFIIEQMLQLKRMRM